MQENNTSSQEDLNSCDNRLGKQGNNLGKFYIILNNTVNLFISTLKIIRYNSNIQNQQHGK